VPKKLSKNLAISVEHLTKRYKSAKEDSVKDISFDVPEGSFFSLLGPNGAGKTTTLSILTTILAPTSGRVLVAGHDVTKNSAEVRENIGVIFQNPSLDLNLTAEENIRFHAILYGLYPYKPTFGMMPKAYQDKVEELATILDLKKTIFQPVKTFSGGMRRKLEILRSLMHQPKILFLDEPTTGLDPLSRRNLWEYLYQIRQKEGVTIFLTTHYLEEAEGSDQICVIDKGQIVVFGTPTEVKKEWKAKTLEDAYLKIIFKRTQEE
jgi:ABC-2 type transport system ATP-binding protein